MFNKISIHYGILIFSGGDGHVFLLNARFLLKSNVLLMLLDELAPQLDSVVLMPEFLQLLAPLLALYLLVDRLTRLLIHADDLGADDLVNLIGGQLIDQVPQLHVGLLCVPRVLIGDGALGCHLLEELWLGVREVPDVLEFGLIQRLVALERQLFMVMLTVLLYHARSSSCSGDPGTAPGDPDSSCACYMSSPATPCA